MAKKSRLKSSKRAHSPTSPAQRACRWLEEGKNAAALTWANSVALDAPDINDLWVAGKILAQCGEVSAAIVRFESLHAKQPQRLEVRHLLACCHASQGDGERALALVDMTLLAPTEFMSLANAFASGNLPVQTQLVLESARTRFPELAQFDLQLADIYAKQGQTAKAIEMLRASALNAETAVADRSRAWFNLGVILESEQKTNAVSDEENILSAEQAYRAAIELEPNYSKPYINLAVSEINEQRVAEAIELLTLAHKRLPDDDKLSYLLAFALRLADDFDRAISLLRNIVARSNHAEAWELLGRCYSETEQHADAARHYQRWLSVEPKNPIATHLLAAATGEAVPSRASAGYVANAFDQFAETFEATVVSKLEYQGPVYMRQLLLEHLGDPGSEGATRIARVLDAGCGTGLMGSILRGYAQELIGLDLSSGMLKQARLKNIYDHLICEDLEAHLRESKDRYGLIVAADTFNYFGDLSQLLALCLSALTQDGWLLFTIEEGPLTEDQYFLQPHGRYVHSPAYLIERLGECGLSGGTMSRVVLRKEADRAVHALLVAIQRPPAEE